MNMKAVFFHFRRIHILYVIFLFLGLGCSSISYQKTSDKNVQKSIPFPGYEQLSKKDKVLADSILGHALDHEALYSLMGDLKPISSIGFSLSYPIAKDSLQFGGV